MTEYLLTITQRSQGRARKGVKPEEKTITIMTLPIQQRQIVDVVRLLNEKPNVKVSKDGVPSEVVEGAKRGD